MTLNARDEAGNEGHAPPVELKLPQRNFTKPLAKALIEQRRLLAFASERVGPCEGYCQFRSAVVGLASGSWARAAAETTITTVATSRPDDNRRPTCHRAGRQGSEVFMGMKRYPRRTAEAIRSGRRVDRQCILCPTDPPANWSPRDPRATPVSQRSGAAGFFKRPEAGNHMTSVSSCTARSARTADRTPRTSARTPGRRASPPRR